MKNQKHFLFILGRNFDLSFAELQKFCEIIFFDREKSLVIAKNLKSQNPRNLPKKEETLFLERLGGVIRFGEILGEFFSERECKNFCWNEIFQNPTRNLTTSKIEREASKETAKKNIKVGFSVFGAGRDFLGKMILQTKEESQNRQKKIRIENFGSQNMNSGQVFETRIIEKGQELIIWKKENSFLVARTLANQNLRNYKLRDRKKPFRDPKMGMLPPKLAQILINLSDPPQNQIIIDPFCGSGTLNIEAAIMGFQTFGSDLNTDFLSGAKENFDTMSEKFRYPKDSGDFCVDSAEKINFETINPFKKKFGNICTEGFLGENFMNQPNEISIKKNAHLVLNLWIKIFQNLQNPQNQNIQKIVFCLPNWRIGRKRISISTSLFEKIDTQKFEIKKPFNGEPTFLYERKETFVSREICVVERKK